MDFDKGFERRFEGKGTRVAGRITGLIHLVARPGTPGGRDRRLRRFANIDIIQYLSNWDVLGDAFADGDPEPVSFRIELDERANILHFGVDGLQFDIGFAGTVARVTNSPAEGKLNLDFLAQAFSTNEPSWFVEMDSRIHVNKVGA